MSTKLKQTKQQKGLEALSFEWQKNFVEQVRDIKHKAALGLFMGLWLSHTRVTIRW